MGQWKLGREASLLCVALRDRIDSFDNLFIKTNKQSDVGLYWQILAWSLSPLGRKELLLSTGVPSLRSDVGRNRY